MTNDFGSIRFRLKVREIYCSPRRERATKGNSCPLCRLAQRNLLLVTRWGLPEFPKQSSLEKKASKQNESWCPLASQGEAAEGRLCSVHL